MTHAEFLDEPADVVDWLLEIDRIETQARNSR